jgi:polysaccharide export outer membrane protein
MILFGYWNNGVKMQVIYLVIMTAPASLFVMQNFSMAYKDVLFVSNAPVVQMQKFITMLFQSVYMVKTFVPSIP